MPNLMMTTRRGVTFHLTITIDPKNIDRFLEALRPCWAAVIKEPNCIFFDVHYLPSKPGTFRFVEIWDKDNEWFERNQLGKEYYKLYWEITNSMWLSRKLEVFDRLGEWSFVGDKYLAESLVADKGVE